MTHDWIALQKRVHHEFGVRVAAVTDWDAPTPDPDRTVRDLVVHVITEQQWVPHLLAGRSTAQAKRDLEPLRDDLLAEWRLYSLAATTAWEQSRSRTSVTLAHDTVTVGEYLREQVTEVTIHTWDLARAIGADEQLDPEIIEAVWSVFEAQEDTLLASGVYSPAAPLPEDAPLQHRVLAFTGRDPGYGSASPLGARERQASATTSSSRCASIFSSSTSTIA